MQKFNILSRRAFLDRNFKAGLGIALSTLVDIPGVMKRALASGTIGLNGKKLLFVFLRGANDGINTVVPILDSGYNKDTNGWNGSVYRPTIAIPPDTKNSVDYSASGPCFDPTQYSLDAGGLLTNRLANDPTFSYNKAIRSGNGFAALHPALKFLAPVYNAGDVALIHRVGYPGQSRSHFSSQRYWENGTPNNEVIKDGIFYRALIESGLAATNPLTGISVQSGLPLLLRGADVAMTNLTDPSGYSLLGIPSTPQGNSKAFKALTAANAYPFPSKSNRDLLRLHYKNMTDTLSIFSGIHFEESYNTFQDNGLTDRDAPYYLFPTMDQKNGGAYMNGRVNNTSKYVVDPSTYPFFANLKAAALVLNKTDALIAGTELSGFDTHNQQGGVTGRHADLLRCIAWSMYALRKYFLLYADKCAWNNLVIVTLSEFGRTTAENDSAGTDHGEAGVMFLAGGAVKGYNKGNASGIFNCHPTDPVPWVTGPTGSMFGVIGGYLQRATDYRSIIGKVIRDHLGASGPGQLSRIITGYGDARENLSAGGICGIDGSPITGEIKVV